MKISIFFNWPPGSNSARVTVGRRNEEDKKYNFRAGFVPKDEKNKISWLKADPIIMDDKDEFTFDVEKGDMVVVDLIDKSGQTKRNYWDTEKEWPQQAVGASTTEVPWTFGE